MIPPQPAAPPAGRASPAPGLAALLAGREHNFIVTAALRPAAPGFAAHAVRDRGATRDARFTTGVVPTEPARDGDREPCDAAADGASGPDPGDGQVESPGTHPPHATVNEIEHARAIDAARADGFAAGREHGAREAEATLGASLAELAVLADGLAAARAFDPAELAADLALTVRALLADVLGIDAALVPIDAGASDPAITRDAIGLEHRARAALEALGERMGTAVLWLAPADAAMLRETLARPGVEIVPDPTLARGALRVTTRHSRIDDSLADRLARFAPSLDERAASLAVIPSSIDVGPTTRASALPLARAAGGMR